MREPYSEIALTETPAAREERLSKAAELVAPVNAELGRDAREIDAIGTADPHDDRDLSPAEAMRRPKQGKGGSRSSRRKSPPRHGTKTCPTCHLEACHCLSPRGKRGPARKYHPQPFRASLHVDIAKFIGRSGGQEFFRALFEAFGPVFEQLHGGRSLEDMCRQGAPIFKKCKDDDGPGAPGLTGETTQRRWYVSPELFERLQRLDAIAKAEGSMIGAFLRSYVIGYIDARSYLWDDAAVDRGEHRDVWRASSVGELRQLCAEAM